MMTQICILPGMLFFLLAAVAYVGVEYLPRLHVWPRRLLVVAVILHTAYLVFWFRQVGAPFITTAADMLLLLAWVLGLAVLWLGRSERWQTLGSWVCPVILMLLVAALHRGGDYAAVREIWPQLWVVPLHLVAATIAVGLFALAFIVGGWLYRQDVRLKRHHITPSTLRMPTIENLARVLSVLLSAGWIVLTVVMTTGAIMLLMRGQPVWAAGFHWVWAVIAWALYAIVLNNRRMQRRRARRGILLSLFGFAAILLTVIQAHSQ